MKHNQKKQNLLKKLNFTIVTNGEKYQIFENLATLIASGVSIGEALEGLENDETSKARSKMIHNLRLGINNGNPLWREIQSEKMIPSHLVPVLRVGEESNVLPEQMLMINHQIQRGIEFKSKLRSASLYPGLITFLLIIVSIIISVFVLPQLTDLYDKLQVELPLSTKIVIGIGNFMGEYGSIFLPASVFTLILVTYLLFINAKTKIVGQFLLLRVPVVKKILKEIEIARFGFLMGTLLKGGFPLDSALDLMIESTDLYIFKNLYKKFADGIKHGKSFKQIFEEEKSAKKIIPTYARQLISTSEKTATLSDAFIKIGEKYEAENERTTKDFSILIEPFMIIIIWLIVGMLAIAIISPIYSLTSGVSDLGSTSFDDAGNKNPERVPK